ncbi:hypothetical protein E2P81_ATG08349 [Venturia nashicola]|uniref:Uncharacterized protein n=1 Tax=Venturia nashicola TaxID=86259 RepID=A0A4Z1NQM4_9PEZI|nr:hypothetical protein E6O75_ATG08538 [Venturia nashicola]TLD21761.1 hypothetical protein E2P81_ATG08349 [Venturia nashicola]
MEQVGVFNMHHVPDLGGHKLYLWFGGFLKNRSTQLCHCYKFTLELVGGHKLTITQQRPVRMNMEIKKLSSACSNVSLPVTKKIAL